MFPKKYIAMYSIVRSQLLTLHTGAIHSTRLASLMAQSAIYPVNDEHAEHENCQYECLMHTNIGLMIHEAGLQVVG